MKRIILATTLSLFGSAVFANNTALINQVKKEVRSQLNDPDSAKFQYVYSVTTISGIKAVCGEVNSKNLYGGYTGFAPFYSYKGYTKIIPYTENSGLAELYAKNYAEAGCAGKAAEKVVNEQRKKDEARWAEIEKAKKEKEEKEKEDAKKEEAEVKRLLPYAICLASYDYIDKRVVKKQKHSLALKEVKNIYDSFYVKYGKGESFESIEVNLSKMADAILSNKLATKKIKNASKEDKQKFLENCVKGY